MLSCIVVANVFGNCWVAVVSDTSGEASHPGPGRYRARRRGSRSAEGIIQRQFDAMMRTSRVDADPVVDGFNFSVFHANARGFLSKEAQLFVLTERLRPSLVLINERFWMHLMMIQFFMVIQFVVARIVRMVV